MNINAQLSPTARRLVAAETIAIASSKQLLRRLYWIYVAGGSAGIVVTFLLALLGYEFTLQQWIAIGIFGTPGILMYTLFDLWLTARHYRARQFSEAQTYFTDALRAHPGDKPSKIFLERCATFLQTPPPMDWDGVWSIAEK